MSGERVLAALWPVIDLFDSLRISYHIGGSVAASTFGEARSTLDVDVVAAVELAHAERIAAALRDQYYVDAELIRSAVEHRSCFNVIFLPQFFKVDVFVPKETPYAKAAFARFILARLVGSGSPREFRFATPEDIVLHKLDWFRLGGGTSDRQWTDILGILRIRGTQMDTGYMGTWAGRIGVADLLHRALTAIAEET
jgi:hypothetical protein